MTVDEWIALEDHERGELVDGHFEEEEVPDYVHELTVSFLVTLLTTWLDDEGFVVGATASASISRNCGLGSPNFRGSNAASLGRARAGVFAVPADRAVGRVDHAQLRERAVR